MLAMTVPWIVFGAGDIVAHRDWKSARSMINYGAQNMVREGEMNSTSLSRAVTTVGLYTVLASTTLAPK